MGNEQLLKQAIQRVTRRSDFPFTPETRIFEDIGLDSTSAMEVLMDLEDHSSLEIDPNSLCIDDFETVQAFTQYLDRNLGQENSAIALGNE
ncbi:acyl carrier protein [Kocuria marina]|uniref:acyl carrier protein n=1 Tax=Kocuria marina TaxID=223184 RepID=UPI0034604D1A